MWRRRGTRPQEPRWPVHMLYIKVRRLCHSQVCTSHMESASVRWVAHEEDCRHDPAIYIYISYIWLYIYICIHMYIYIYIYTVYILSQPYKVLDTKSGHFTWKLRHLSGILGLQLCDDLSCDLRRFPCSMFSEKYEQKDALQWKNGGLMGFNGI